MERFFQIVKRINQLLVLLLLLGMAGLMIFGVFESSRWNNHNSVEVAETGAEKAPVISFTFSSLETINGSDVQVMELKTDKVRGKFSRNGLENQVRNLVFLTDGEKEPRWLFKDHKNLIVKNEQLTEIPYGEKMRPTRALYIAYVDEDTNGDKFLSEDDQRNIALTKPDGKGMTVVLSKVDKIFSHHLSDAEHVSFIYQKNGSVKRASFLLTDFSLLQDQEILAVPDKPE
jgi:hypothetical protein